MLTMLFFITSIAIGYLVGSICSAVIVCHIFGLPDPRTEGSKNPGATNVMRLSGKKYGVIVLIADMLKGLLPVLAVKLLGADAIIASFTCLAAVVGHMYPIFFNFRGGKGVATLLGGLLGFHFMLGVMVIATWLIVANFSRYSSLSSLVSVTLMPFYSSFALNSPNAFIPLAIIAALIIYKHHENIARLLKGTESKISLRGQSKKTKLLNELQAIGESELNNEVPKKKSPAKKKTNTPKRHAATKATTKKKTTE